MVILIIGSDKNLVELTRMLVYQGKFLKVPTLN